ncbi:MAG: hypothetical protein DMF78_15945 [Acidobacteria bacterium]|nr:MAG: hypothetical protein DMF78_15945 [Acidobacteriota bacterium]
MSDIEFRAVTTRSVAQVKSALETEIRSRLPGERIKKFWEGDVFRLVGMGADGRIEVSDGEIRAHATLKPPLSLMKGRVEQGLRETVAAAAGPQAAAAARSAEPSAPASPLEAAAGEGMPREELDTPMASEAGGQADVP